MSDIRYYKVTGLGTIACPSHDNYIVAEFYAQDRIWESHLLDVFRDHITPGSTVIDCGAYLGGHTLAIHNLDRQNAIFSLEMMPFHYSLLLQTISLNSLDRVRAIHCAVGDGFKVVSIPRPDYGKDCNFGGCRIAKILDRDLVPVLPLDSLPILKPVSLIKVDVEGLESQVISGAKNLISLYRPVLILEIWKNHPLSPDIVDFLDSLGYTRRHLGVDDYLFTCG